MLMDMMIARPGQNLKKFFEKNSPMRPQAG
jgi:hypothetical protein